RAPRGPPRVERRDAEGEGEVEGDEEPVEQGHPGEGGCGRSLRRRGEWATRIPRQPPKRRARPSGVRRAALSRQGWVACQNWNTARTPSPTRTAAAVMTEMRRCMGAGG